MSGASLTTRAAPTSDQELLEHRARQLARPTLDAPVRTRRFLVWAVDGTQLAIDVCAVRAVRDGHALTRLPSGTGPLVAVIEDRGEVIAVVSSGQLVGSGSTSEGSHVIVLDDGHHPALGLLTGAVPRLVDVAADRLGPAPEALERPPPHLVHAVTTAGTVVLDATALLDDPAYTSRNESR